MSHVSVPRAVRTLALLGAFASTLHASDWTNNGGNAQRNGRSDQVGPLANDLIWNKGRSSIIAWEPFVMNRRVFVVRQTGFPPSGEPDGSPVVCQSLDTGNELWARNVPYVSGDWTTWILGVGNGRVYASRSGNGSTVHQVVYALDETSGATVWTSAATIDAGPYDGVVFAPGGDLVVGNQMDVTRISAVDGTTVWSVPRLCSVTSSCGVALGDDAVYLAEPVPGGHWIRKLELASGASLYQTPLMPGFTLQNTPFVGPDGTVYLSRTQNNTNVDFLYAFEDTGSALVEKWHVDAGWSTTSEFACASDGSVFMLDRTLRIQRLDADTGATLATSVDPIASGSVAPHMAVDRSDKLFVSNGGFGNGRLFAFDPDLVLRWSLAVPNVNQGGPALGADGTLVIAGTGTNVRALRSSCNSGAEVAFRNVAPNVPSLAGDAPLLGSTWNVTVDLASTGHTTAVLFAFDSPTDFELHGGQHVLCANTGGSGKLVHLSGVGDLVPFSIPIPNDASLCGFAFSAQALHIGGVQPFVLSNALDLVLGG